MAAAGALTLPTLDPAIEYLQGLGDPTVELRLARLLDADADLGMLRARVGVSEPVRDALATQREDGSWGEKDHPGKRLLPTLWMVKTLGELGLDATHDGWRQAVEFLQSVGHTDDGVFSIWGTRDGVLSCYVGLAAIIYLNGGLDELATKQIDWILRYQEIKAGGRDLRREPVAEWSSHLKTKYGGCMAETTCLVGLLREGRALANWGGVDGQPLVNSIRQAFLDRRVMFRSNGSIVPLAVSANKADSWLAPSFPLDWRVDLLEAVDFLVRTGGPDPRLREAIDRIAGFQLPDGTWPLRRTYRPDHLPGVERPSPKKSSPMITLRVVEALWPLVAVL
jgi:hypothetical protein